MTKEEFQNRWEELLKVERFRPSRNTEDPEYEGESYKRIPFDSDYSRVAMSAPFRRLQDKAQVFPLEKLDFSRTRLTHSIEVSAVARSLGVSIENILLNKGFLKPERKGHISSLLSVSGLVHDIGNPPFGHSGEKTIQSFFKKYFETPENKKGLTEEECCDFKNFDGNVQGFRLLLKLGFATDEYSYNLTFPTLASIVKYPKSSTEGNKKDFETHGGIEYKKFGYFQSEKEKFHKIDSALKLNKHRHPLTFLMEAADDIAYSVSDIEDGCKKGAISIDTMIALLEKSDYREDSRCAELLNEIKALRAKLETSDIPNKEMVIAQECRVNIQMRMISDVIFVFMQNQEKILNGTFDKELLSISRSSTIRSFTKEIADFNFRNKEVLKNELIGENVISYLLSEFVDAVLSPNIKDQKTKEYKLYSILSQQYKYIINDLEQYKNEKYKLLMLVLDYISGMTDTYALTLYQELNGIN